MVSDQQRNAVDNMSHKRHAAVLAFPFGCHAKPVLNLVCKLAKAAPDTRFSFINTSKSNNSLFQNSKSENLENIIPYNVSYGVPTNHVLTGNPLEAVDLFLKAAPKNFKTCIEKAIEDATMQISCLITDGFLVFGSQMADDFGVPWIPIWIPLPCTLSAHIYTDTIRHLYINDGVNGQVKTLEAIPSLSTMRIEDLPDEVLPSESLFSETLRQIGKVLPQSAVVVMNFYQELNPTVLENDLKSKSVKLLNVGFLTLSLPLPPLPLSESDATGCLSWLDDQQASSVVYISFGTVGVPSRSELVALAEALEAIDAPFLWSLRGSFKDLLPNDFVERVNKNGRVVSWVPQTQVLRHSSIGVFVTHCGCNSVYESITNGVPMICRPLFGDHRMTGRMVEEVWGVGVKVEGGVITKNGIIKNFKLILEDDKGKEVREKARALKEIVKEAAGPSGSAIQDFNTLVDIISLL
ncbi:anthocyanidin 3-O-glucosyltransferase 7-like [Argentina anserina]|uniref:anthocyanidin 3-O-glucosyltransferase 7-like n=1 Tax=Argentina anserina TaxID=57926 RepID=UPI0021764D82|nr:anthocyanidin 3-O-glucosyltransferase 7-like [Potentilla anserina]